MLRSPPAAREDLSDHVVVCTATTNTESLVDELTGRDVPYMIVEPNREMATDLFEWTEIAAGERVFVAGTDAALERLDGVLSATVSGSGDS